MSATEYYNHSTYPSNGASGSSSAMRAELELIEAGFGLMPDLSGNGGALVVINAGGTALTKVTAGATTELLVGGGAGAVPVWTAATGTGSPVRGTSPSFTTSVVTGSTTFAAFNTTATTINAFGGASVALNMGHASGTNTILGATNFSQTVTLIAPVLGTPASGTLTNCTGLPAAGLVASTSQAVGFGSIELGHATDTTISRVSAGVVAVEGVNILMNGGALGTPSSGTVTNLTGTASININGTVGATTPTTGAFTTISSTGNVTLGDATADTVGFGTATVAAGNGWSGSGGKIQISNSGASTPTSVNIRTFSATSGFPAILELGKSASNTLNTLAETASGDTVGVITFDGVNSSSAIRALAGIACVQDAAAGATHVPGAIVFYTSSSAATDVERFRIDSSGNVIVTGAGGIGYGTGSGGTVTQASSRTTGVTLNKTNGAITLVSAAGTATWQSFTVTNSTVAATDTIKVSQKSGTDLNMIHVTAVGAGSFRISFATTGGTTTEQPVFNFAVLKAVTA